MTVTSRVQSQSHEALALAPALRCGWVTAEGGIEGGRPQAHEPHSSLERGHHCAVVGSPGRAGETLRLASVPCTLVPGAPGGTQLAATPEGGGSGSGGAAAGSGPRRPRVGRRRRFGRLRAAREPAGHPGLRGDDGEGRR